MLNKTKGVENCLRKTWRVVGERKDVVVDLKHPESLGKDPSGESLGCGQSTTREFVSLEVRQVGTEAFDAKHRDVIVADIIVNCPEPRCIHHSQYQG